MFLRNLSDSAGMRREKNRRVLRFASSCSDEAEEVLKNFLLLNLKRDVARRGRLPGFEREENDNRSRRGDRSKILPENFLQPALTIRPRLAPRWGQPKAVEKIFIRKSWTAKAQSLWGLGRSPINSFLQIKRNLKR
jgi:hypothetical protein